MCPHHTIQSCFSGPEVSAHLDKNACLKLPTSADRPPEGMPLAIELVNNSTVFSFADLQNFDTTKIFVQNQNTEWGSQVRQGELVRYQVKSAGSNVAGATVVIKDANGKPLYSMETDAFGFTPQVSYQVTSC